VIVVDFPLFLLNSLAANCFFYFFLRAAIFSSPREKMAISAPEKKAERMSKIRSRNNCSMLLFYSFL
jgi:hypothetical protein